MMMTKRLLMKANLLKRTKIEIETENVYNRQHTFNCLIIICMSNFRKTDWEIIVCFGYRCEICWSFIFLTVTGIGFIWTFSRNKTTDLNEKRTEIMLWNTCTFFVGIALVLSTMNEEANKHNILHKLRKVFTKCWDVRDRMARHTHTPTYTRITNITKNNVVYSKYINRHKNWQP